MNTGIDGGMNKVFAARVPDGNTGLSEGGDGQGLSLLSLSRAPGTIPSHVNPPRAAASDNLLLGAPEEPSSSQRLPAPAAPAPTRVANAAPSRAVRRLLLQPRPQGRHWRLADATASSAAAARASRKVESQANRARRRAHEAAVPKTPTSTEGRTQAGRQPAAR